MNRWKLSSLQDEQFILWKMNRWKAVIYQYELIGLNELLKISPEWTHRFKWTAENLTRMNIIGLNEPLKISPEWTVHPLKTEPLKNCHPPKWPHRFKWTAEKYHLTRWTNNWSAELKPPSADAKNRLPYEDSETYCAVETEEWWEGFSNYHTSTYLFTYLTLPYINLPLFTLCYFTLPHCILT